MKIIGIIFIIIGGLDILMSILGLLTLSQYSEQQIRSLIFGIAALGGGIYCLHRTKTRQMEQKEKEEWGRNNSKEE